MVAVRETVICVFLRPVVPGEDLVQIESKTHVDFESRVKLIKTMDHRPVRIRIGLGRIASTYVW